MREPGGLGALERALARAAAVLPTQAILENFIHHNPLHHFEDTDFHAAIERVHGYTGLEGYGSEAYFEARYRAGAIHRDDVDATLAGSDLAVDHAEALAYLTADRSGDAVARARLAEAVEDRLENWEPKVEPAFDGPGLRVAVAYGFDPIYRVHEAVSELAATFLDRGAAGWAVPGREKGFLHAFTLLETTSFSVPWRRRARAQAAQTAKDLAGGASPEALAEALIVECLDALGTPEEAWEDHLRANFLKLPGWGGMFERMESVSSEGPSEAKVRLVEFAAVFALLERSSIEAALRDAGVEGVTTAAGLQRAVRALPTRDDARRREARDRRVDELTALFERRRLDAQRVRVLADDDWDAAVDFIERFPERMRRRVWLEAMERTWFRELSAGMRSAARRAPAARPEAQLVTCIDDREESFRRHFEQLSPGHETLGIAGFFGLAVRYRPLSGGDVLTLAPVGVNVRSEMSEEVHPEDEAHHALSSTRRRRGARLNLAWYRATRTGYGSLLAAALTAPFAVARLVLETFAPETFYRVRHGLRRAALPSPRGVLTSPFTTEEAVNLLATQFENVGLTDRFARLFIVLGHGSQSVNNPYFAAYDCGACSGRHGTPNARLFALLGNDPAVRAGLAARGVVIPDDTVFLGGLHNTATDAVELFDLHAVPESHRADVERAKENLKRAAGQNALERCRRFALAEGIDDEAAALAHVRARAEDIAEARPELNHATNAWTLVARRHLTRGLFLDRRAFLVSYDPAGDDDGKRLERLLGAALPVCSGINLEYYFSATDPDRVGSGTKVPLNAVGHLGMMQGIAGDLHAGLPTQMTEVHTPLRSFFVVESPAERVEAILARRPELGRLVHNGWVRMALVDPARATFSLFHNGSFVPLPDETRVVPAVPSYTAWFSGRSDDLPVARIASREVAA